MKKKVLLVVLALGLAVAACAAPTPEVVEKEVVVEKPVIQTVVVEKEVVVEKPVVETVIVEKEVVVEKPVIQTVIVEKEVVVEKPVEYKEAPMLAEMVAAGELPPVDERLPKDPVVIEPYQGVIGTYGGTLRGFVEDGAWQPLRFFKYDKLVRLNPYYGPDNAYIFKPDIADWWELSDDGKEFTYHIREGMKWSDGVPLTTEDMRFYWEDVMQNDELRDVVGVQKKLGEIEVIDDLTFKIVCEEQNEPFKLDQASGGWAQPFWFNFPAHYLKQFHADYATQADLDAKMKEYKMDTWVQMFDNRRQFWTNPDLPQVSAWVLEREPDATGLAVWKRNPYYYKVDTEGNQLPYIDRWNAQNMTSEVAQLKVMQGEVDFHWMNFRIAQYPMLKEGEEQGHYTVGPEFNNKKAEGCLFINQTTEDEVLREIFQDKRFRMAFSHAINRQEIVDTVFHGLGDPTGFCVGDYVAFSNPEWCEKYADYDPDLSNELLEEMGLEWDAAKEVRLRPDGEPLETIFRWPTYRAGFEDAYNLIVEYLGDVGIRVIMKPLEGSVWNVEAKTDAGELSTGSNAFNMTNAFYMWGFNGYNYGSQWRDWFTSEGEEGTEPTIPWVKEMFDELRKGMNATTIDGRVDAYYNVMDLAVENLYIIAFYGHDPRPSIVHDRLKNFNPQMENLVNPEFISYPAGSRYPEQWWIDPDWTP